MITKERIFQIAERLNFPKIRMEATRDELLDMCDLAAIGLKAKEMRITDLGSFTVPPDCQLREVHFSDSMKITKIVTSKAEATNPTLSVSVGLPTNFGKTGCSAPMKSDNDNIHKLDAELAKEAKMEITKDMMPDHPRFQFDSHNGMMFCVKPGTLCRVPELHTWDREDAVCIAYTHFTQQGILISREDASPSVKNKLMDRAFDMAQKWLSLLKAPMVFGKDWN